MSTLANALYVPAIFLAVLTVVVFIHEMGHFLVARWCGVAVEAFSIGFGREICGFTDRHGTRWKLSWIPLGGYVKFIDDENSASAPSKEALDKLTPEQRAGAFQTQPLASKAAIVAAGPAFNIISALLILIGSLWTFGNFSTKAIVDDVVAESPAAKAGIRAGDRILAIEGSNVTKFNELQRVVSQSVGKPLKFEVERGGQRQVLAVTPEMREVFDPLCNKVTIGAIGVRRDPPPLFDKVSPESLGAKAGLRSGDIVTEIGGRPIRFASEVQKAITESPGKSVTFTVKRGDALAQVTMVPEIRKMKDASCREIEGGTIGVDQIGGAGQWEHHSYTFAQAFAEGTKETYQVAKQIVTSIPALPGAILKVLSGKQQSELGGPIAIAEMTAHAGEGGMASLLGWVAVFSIMLGIMNLLPIPLLDGGHLVFYAIEAVRGRPLDERKQELSFRIGMALLATMMFAALVGDFMRKFGVG